MGGRIHPIPSYFLKGIGCLPRSRGTEGVFTHLTSHPWQVMGLFMLFPLCTCPSKTSWATTWCSQSLHSSDSLLEASPKAEKGQLFVSDWGAHTLPHFIRGAHEGCLHNAETRSPNIKERFVSSSQSILDSQGLLSRPVMGTNTGLSVRSL